ncbi:MAG: NADH-quinone oxidoreductase subunit J [Gammaproteobacteria bacterium]|nr:NADH-quinone oxidoreductase subunit J [Gammaproteobacteria bacterium]
MNIEVWVFLTFSLVAVASAVRVITVNHSVHAALFLVLTFFSCAGIWLLAEAEFLGLTLVLVYVGAVMVLFLFVVMMLDVDTAPMQEGFTRYLPLGLVIGLVMVAEMVLVVASPKFSSEKLSNAVAHGADYSNTEELGKAIYTDYLYQFEIAAVILLVAIIAAIALTLRKRPETKYQKPSEQVKVKKSDRLRIVKMKSEQH